MPERTGPTVARLLLGSRLRQLRTDAGLKGPEVGDLIEGSASKISRMERGLIPVADADLGSLLELYGVSDPERTELLDLARQSRSAGWWNDYREIQGPRRTALQQEAEGAVLKVFDPFAVPVLLQTPDYARLVCEANNPRRPEWRGGIGPPVLARRRALMSTPNPPRLWAIIAESVLRRAPSGNPDVLDAQLASLRSAARKQHIVIQIVPDDDLSFLTAPEPFTLIQFGGYEVRIPDVVLIERPVSLEVAVERNRVGTYREAFDALSVNAVYPAASERILEDPAAWFYQRAQHIRRMYEEHHPPGPAGDSA